MIFKIETTRRWTELSRRPYQHIVITSNETTVLPGELTEYQRKLLQHVLDNDKLAKECEAEMKNIMDGEETK